MKSLACVVGAGLLLTACASDKPSGARPSTAAGVASGSEPAPVLRAPEPASELRPRARPSFDAKRFIGQDIPGIQRSLGAPALRQQETFAEVWQYVAGPCVLHLYFYRPKGAHADAPLRVEQALVETRPGPWGDNLNPQGICALEFSGRTPVTAPVTAKAPQTQKRR